jgi:hypothetical protein
MSFALHWAFIAHSSNPRAIREMQAAYALLRHNEDSSGIGLVCEQREPRAHRITAIFENLCIFLGIARLLRAHGA